MTVQILYFQECFCNDIGALEHIICDFRDRVPSLYSLFVSQKCGAACHQSLEVQLFFSVFHGKVRN